MNKATRILLLTVVSLGTAVGSMAQNAAWKSTVEPLGDNAYRIVLEASIPQQEKQSKAR